MSEGLKITLDELNHLILYRAVLAELVVASGGELVINLAQKPPLLFISYRIEQGKEENEASIRINVERILNIH